MNKQHRVWSLQDAKAKFSEVVRLAQSEGPQIVTVHGQPSVEIVSSSPLGGDKMTIEEFVSSFQQCPIPDFEIPRLKTSGKQRAIKF
ncbi:MAG: type II toxin-antitoxin system Phd/YefM family antitoxin [Alphaproteobacteria bacterium]|nr:type II toxin-antitoxin system Phd/YefM family antitoxin [Alphaproteobacteria bacterium]